MSKKATRKWKIIALFGFLLVFFSLLVFLFSGENFGVLKEIFRSGATKDEVRQSIEKLGIRSYIVVGLIAMLQVLLTFVPAEPLHVVSGISFGLWKGMLICFIGILLGNTLIFVLNKIFGSKLKDFFSTNIDIDFNKARTSTKLALIIIILYCLPAIPYGIICFFAASMNMKYPKYLLITGLGSIPSLVLDVGLGHITMSTSWIISIIVFVVIVVLLIIMLKFKTQIFGKVNEYIRKSHEKEKNRVGKYNPFIFKGIGIGVYGFIKTKVKIKLKNNVGKLDKPCIVLCSHGSFFDFVYAGKMLMKHKPHFIVARLYFHHKLLGKILNGTGAFPKSMFSADIDCMKNSLKVLSNKEMLCLMPEARLSTVGKFEGIQDATYKFIKKMNVPVYSISINGSYLAKPKWGDKIRRGALVEAELNLLFKEKECENLSVEEVKRRVDAALNYNEWDWLDQHPNVKYKTKNIAKGLENILCMCPNCKAICSLETKKNVIKCSNCGMEVSLDNRYQLHGTEFRNIAEWYEWIKDEFRQMLKSNPNYVLESKVELKHLSKDGKRCTRYAGVGVCKLDKNGLIYQGTQDGEEVAKVFKLNDIYRLLFGSGENFEIYDGQEIYYFVPEDKRSSVIWYIFSELLKE